MPTLGQQIKAAREGLGLTRYRLHQQTGLTQTGLAKLEGGGTEPRWATVVLVARALGLSLDALAEKSSDSCSTTVD